MAQSKSDQIRALREQAYEARLSSPNYDGCRAKLKREAQANIVNNAPLNKPVVINALSKSPAERQAKWRKANKDLNRQRAKEGMRKKRAQSSNVTA
jgi:hypothetical protein